jgi:hypothetical protein
VADGPLLIFAEGGGAAPFTIPLANDQRCIPTTITAIWDGSGAAADFLPCVSYYSPTGVLLGRYGVDAGSITAGDSAELTYAPFLGPRQTTPTPSGSGVPWCLATDDHSTLAAGHTDFDFSDSFDTSDGTLFDTIVSGGLTLVRIKTTGFYRLTCQTNALETNTVTGVLTSGWTFSPPGRFTGYEFEFGTPIGIAVDDGGNSNWFISSQQVLNVFGAANVTPARFVDSAASGTIGTQATSLLVERLSDSV